MTRAKPDPRVYGVAPVHAEAHDGAVLWTMVGVMAYLGMSETAIRATPALMRMRRRLRARVYRWVPAEVMAWAAAQTTAPVLPPDWTPAPPILRRKRQVGAVRRAWQAAFAAKLQAET